MPVRAVLSTLAELAFPASCPGCGRPAEPLCATCRRGLRPAPAGPLPAGVAGLVSAFAYEGVARELVARAKYRHRHAALGWLAAAAVDAWRASDAPPVDAVTWAPSSPDHRREHGLDHGRVLATAVARELGVGARALLVRSPGPPQTSLVGAGRRRGPRLRATTRVAGAVLVVDDVVTTGATLAACAGALRAAGAREVRALTVARTPRPGDAR